MLKFIVLCAEMVIGWTVVFLKACIFISLSLLGFHHAAKVPSWENSVMRDYVVQWSWFIIMQMLETCRIGMTQKEWHKSVSIINTVHFLSLKEFKNVVLYNWILSNCCRLSTSCFKTNCITKSKNIVIFFMLECIFVNINSTVSIGKTSISKEFMRVTWWVDACWDKIFFNCNASIYIFKCCDLLSNWVFLNLNQFPSKHNFNSSFMTFIKCNFVCIRETIDFLIRCPILNSWTSWSTSLNLIHSHKVFIITSIKIGTFTFIWSFWWIAK